MKRKICFAAWALALMLLLPLCAALAEATDGEAEYTAPSAKDDRIQGRQRGFCPAGQN